MLQDFTGSNFQVPAIAAMAAVLVSRRRTPEGSAEHLVYTEDFDIKYHQVPNIYVRHLLIYSSLNKANRM
jgi:hypothetical protein